MITIILLVFAFVFFAIGAFFGGSAPSGPWFNRINLPCAGLACWVFAEILSRSGLVGR